MPKALWIGLLASLAAVMTRMPAAAQQQRPNILCILADNVGYGDIGAYGGGELRGAPTPRIDQLAAESLRLTQFLVEPGCTPSRAALMTGRYSIRSGLSLVAVPGSPNSLPTTEITIAEVLREAGYATAMFGKWHLGQQGKHHPSQRGFDEAIVSMILDLSRALGLRVVAEGVETTGQLDQLRRWGCPFMQGFHFGRPMPAEQVEDFLGTPQPVLS